MQIPGVSASTAMRILDEMYAQLAAEGDEEGGDEEENDEGDSDGTDYYFCCLSGGEEDLFEG